MSKRRVVKRFRSRGEEVIFRYPKMSDSDDLLRNINALIAERAFIALQDRQTRVQEEKWLSDLLAGIRKKQKVALVVEISGKVVGLAQVEKKPEKSASHVGSFGISLVKEARGRGIGKKLTLAVITEAKKILEIRIVTLSAVAQNHPAVSCYRKCGFVKTETIKGGIKHHGRYLDRIRMVKYL